MRFDSAREAGLDEDKASLVDDGYEQRLDARSVAALQLTDALIGLPQALTSEEEAQLRAHFSAGELAELTLGVGLFLGMSKVLIALGLEPEDMPVTVIPTPGSAPRAAGAEG